MTQAPKIFYANSVRFVGEAAFLKLTNMEREVVVDIQAYSKARRGVWYGMIPKKNRNGIIYAAARVDKKSVLLHRFLLEPEKTEQVDHIDGDGLNNRLKNLRIASRAHNSQRARKAPSRSGYIGVYAHKKKFNVRVSKENKTYCLGTYADPRKAARVYDSWVRKNYGKHARLNFPSTEPLKGEQP